VRSDLPSVSRAARFHARPPATRPSRPSRNPHRRQARRNDFELFRRAVEHCFGRADLRLANGRRRLDIHSHRMLEIDEIVVGVGISGDGVGRSGLAGRRIGQRDRLRRDRRRPAEGRVVKDRQIFGDCATGRRIKVLDLGDDAPSMRIGRDHAGVDCRGLDEAIFRAPTIYCGSRELNEVLEISSVALLRLPRVRVARVSAD
jgi:hypothetical protein